MTREAVTPTATATMTIVAPTVTAPITATTVLTATVSANSANIRIGPGFAYPVLKIVYKGLEIVVIGRNARASWLAILFDGDNRGWIILTAVLSNYDIEKLPIFTAEPPPTSTPGEPRFRPGGGKG